jgi:hypothetical protein
MYDELVSVDCNGTGPRYPRISQRKDGGYIMTWQNGEGGNNNGADTYYVQSATLNGKPYQSCHIPNSEIFKGGKLVLEMGTEPNENWGK